MAGLGGGALVGMVAAAVLPTPRPRRFGTLVIAILACASLGLAALAFVDAMPVAVGVTAVIGVVTGYGNLLPTTWAQRRIPKALMGRVVSIIGLGSMALIPLSQLIAGAAVQVSLAGTLLASGGAMFVVTLASIGTATVRGMGLEPTLGAQRAACLAEDRTSAESLPHPRLKSRPDEASCADDHREQDHQDLPIPAVVVASHVRCEQGWHREGAPSVRSIPRLTPV